MHALNGFKTLLLLQFFLSMSKSKTPYLIDFHQIGDDSIGHISVAEMENNVPFAIKRVFWTYGTPETVERGNHAHKTNEEIIVPVTGEITITTESINGEMETFVLDNPNRGLYIPTNVWIKMSYIPGTVQLVINSSLFKEEEYIRSYKDFKAL